MNVKQARQLDTGDKVYINHKDYTGSAIVVTPNSVVKTANIHINIYGIRFLWVEVQLPKQKAVFSSHYILK